MTWHELKMNGRRMLRQAGIDNADYDGDELFYFVSGMSPSSYPLHMQEEAAPDAAGQYEALIRRRAGHEPLQYITGTAYFYGEEFYVEPGVLIPRYDTETLIESLIPYLNGRRTLLDLCCGSGCILATLLMQGSRDLYGTGADISDTALRVTEKNLKKFGLEGRSLVLKSDLFSNITGTYDIIASNPPYIPEQEIEGLQAEVRDFEPRSALNGGADGLTFYKRITEDARNFLNPNGILAFEIGFDEGSPVALMMREKGFSDVSVYQDLSGNDRVVSGIYLASDKNV